MLVSQGRPTPDTKPHEQINSTCSVYSFGCGGTVNESSIFNVPDAVSADAEADSSAIRLKSGWGGMCQRPSWLFGLPSFLKCVEGYAAQRETPRRATTALDDECAPG